MKLMAFTDYILIALAMSREGRQHGALQAHLNVIGDWREQQLGRRSETYLSEHWK